PKTLEELAIELNISRERVRQIEVGAFEKLKKIIEKMIQSEKIIF
ncbi:MAG: RNA polymerase factor sigma-32, partial [Proteobacteria bacterium]|nr:RNA polymerase factor sigma-32 [Pseudomonadota bacterium]